MLKAMTRDDAVSLWVIACHDAAGNTNALGGTAIPPDTVLAVQDGEIVGAIVNVGKEEKA